MWFNLLKTLTILERKRETRRTWEPSTTSVFPYSICKTSLTFSEVFQWEFPMLFLWFSNVFPSNFLYIFFHYFIYYLVVNYLKLKIMHEEPSKHRCKMNFYHLFQISHETGNFQSLCILHVKYSNNKFN